MIYREVRRDMVEIIVIQKVTEELNLDAKNKGKEESEPSLIMLT